MNYEKVKEQIRETLDEARDYAYANSKPNDYGIRIGKHLYFYVYVKVDLRGNRFMIASVDSWDFEPLRMHLDPFMLKGEYLDSIITAFAKCFEQIEKEK